MSTLSTSVTIDAPAAEVWPVLADLGRVQNWHSKVARSPVLSEKATGLGAVRRCEFYDGTSVVEKVIGIEEGKSLTIELSEFSMPFSRATGVIELHELGPNKSRVVMTMEYDTKYGPVGWLMDAAMIRPMMTGLLGEVLKGLAHHVETGEIIGEHGPIRNGSAEQRAAV